jgi:hypothetical protein
MPQQAGNHAFWMTRSLDDLAKEQQVDPQPTARDLIGQASGLWDNDQEFERFLMAIRDRRHEPSVA